MKRGWLTPGDSSSERENCWREYVRAIRAGNADALGRLYDATAPMLYGVAFRIMKNSADAEEVLLDVYERVWRMATTFDPTRGSTLRWLMLLTRSRALDRLRSVSSRRHHEYPEIAGQQLSSPEPLPDELIILSQEQNAITRALYALPPDQRKALELAFFSGLTHTEIATTLGIPLGTIKARVRMAMGKLRAALQPLASGRSEKSRSDR